MKWDSVISTEEFVIPGGISSVPVAFLWIQRFFIFFYFFYTCFAKAKFCSEENFTLETCYAKMIPVIFYRSPEATRRGVL